MSEDRTYKFQMTHSDIGKSTCARTILRRDAPTLLMEKLTFIISKDLHINPSDHTAIETGAGLMWQIINDPEFFKEIN